MPFRTSVGTAELCSIISAEVEDYIIKFRSFLFSLPMLPILVHLIIAQRIDEAATDEVLFYLFIFFLSRGLGMPLHDTRRTCLSKWS